MKTCTKCSEEKSLEEFPFQNKQKKQRMSWCGVCKNKYQRERYKREPEKVKDAVKKWHKEHRFNTCLIASRAHAKKLDYMSCTATPEEIKAAFTGKCHACGVPEIECRRRLCIDHDHETGDFRGWLCDSCNRAIGILKNSSNRIMALAEYVERVTVSIFQS